MNHRFDVKLKKDKDPWGSFIKLQIWRNGRLIEEYDDNRDGGKQTFSQDLKWIPVALNQAYEFGKIDAS